MKSVLPLEVLGLVGPILCWVESTQRPGLPESWRTRGFDFEERVRNWLMQELPTYSYDNLDEVISLAGDRRVLYLFPYKPRGACDQAKLRILPKGFDLTCMFSQLSRRYFQWAGSELCIRENRIVELHELAMRFPVRHLIQFCHAEALARGYISMDRAFELPSQMSQLPTTYQSLRTVVDKGLSDGHLHLKGVINADEAWSDHLLQRLTSGAKEDLSDERHRLLTLGRSVIRLLAAGLLYSELDEKEEHLPYHLIDLLDKIYRARTPMESQILKEHFDADFWKALRDLKSILSRELPEEKEDEQESSPAELAREKTKRWESQTKRLSGEKLRQFEWLMPLINSDMNFNQVPCIHTRKRDDTFEEFGARARMRLLKRLHLNIIRVLLQHNVRSPLPAGQGKTFDTSSANRRQNQDPNAPREFIHQLAYRYMIYHTHHWQQATQSGKTTGLRNFQLYFDAPQRELLSRSDIDAYGVAIERLSMAKPLRVVEGRLSPPDTGAAKYLPWVLAFAQQVKEDNLDKFGIVVHFKKSSYKKEQWKTQQRNLNYLRDGRIRRRTRADAIRLYRVLSKPHPVVPFIVGIDAANLELTTPPEVFAPAFRFLREYPIKLHRRNSTKEHYGKIDAISALLKNRRLGLTYHVGEDFRHLLSGLRAIHEVIEFLKPLPGDRLGHAIALALKPEIWAAQVGYQAVMPQQEWLDTLVWLHYLLGPGHDLIGELAIEDKIQLFARKIYGNSAPGNGKSSRSREPEWLPITLYDSWRLRQLDPYSVASRYRGNNKFKIRKRGDSEENKRWAEVQTTVLNEVDRHVGTNAAYDLVKLYWHEPRVRDEGKRIITVEMQDEKDTWLSIFGEAQKKIQNLVRDKQLVVEVNPTSNRFIGPMESMADHPIFQLTLDKQQQMEKQIRVTINTDDPGVFATSLPHEYYLMGESLLARGVPEPEVVEWLEWLRKNGTDYSFLHGMASANDKHMKSLLDHLLKKYARLLHRLKGKRRIYRSPGDHDELTNVPAETFSQLKAKLAEIEKKNYESEKQLEELKNQISAHLNRKEH